MPLNFNKKHPECQSDEVFVGNTDQSDWSHIDWKTKRKGHTAYDIDGNPLNKLRPGLFPVFVKKSEIHDEDPTLLELFKA